jgi:hypothetical protein
MHIWAHANPHTIREARHQTTFSINVWAGTPVTNVDELWERIVATFDAVRNRPGQLERVRESMM